jgi:hypothetical protein
LLLSPQHCLGALPLSDAGFVPGNLSFSFLSLGNRPLDRFSFFFPFFSSRVRRGERDAFPFLFFSFLSYPLLSFPFVPGAGRRRLPKERRLSPKNLSIA